MVLIKCPECGAKLTDEMIEVNMCWECGYILDKSQLDEETVVEINKQSIENNPYSSKMFNDHLLTTGVNFEGFSIKEYKGLVSGDVVLGTGVLSEIKSGLSDLFGAESDTYSEKIKTAKQKAVNDMICNSLNIGGNAIIGISYQISSFAGSNMIMISVNGTSVCVTSNS